MCYDDLARPPLPPGMGGGSNGEDIVLTAADGNRFNAYVAGPEQPRGAQILIYPDVRGLHQFYRELALRFADVGISAIAMDYFGRTAGLTPRDDKFDFMAHVQQIRLPGLYADATAALNYLRQGDGDLFNGLSEFARGIEAIASEAADLAMQHRPQDALTVLSNAAPELFATRKAANALALQLTEMQTQFRRRALGLPPE